MAVGLRVRNQGTGQIQIGAGYRNLQLAKSGTLNTGTFSGGGTGGIIAADMQATAWNLDQAVAVGALAAFAQSVFVPSPVRSSG